MVTFNVGFSPGTDYQPGTAAATLVKAGTALNGLQAAIQQPIQLGVINAQRTTADLEQAVTSNITSKLASATQVLNRATRSITDGLTNTVAAAYTAAADVGVKVPTAAQLAGTAKPPTPQTGSPLPGSPCTVNGVGYSSWLVPHSNDITTQAVSLQTHLPGDRNYFMLGTANTQNILTILFTPPSVDINALNTILAACPQLVSNETSIYGSGSMPNGPDFSVWQQLYFQQNNWAALDVAGTPPPPPCDPNTDPTCQPPPPQSCPCPPGDSCDNPLYITICQAPPPPPPCDPTTDPTCIPPPIVCPPGQHDDGTGTCVCDDGSPVNPDGTCGPPPCPPGTVDDGTGTGTCIPAPPPPISPPPTTSQLPWCDTQNAAQLTDFLQIVPTPIGLGLQTISALGNLPFIGSIIGQPLQDWLNQAQQYFAAMPCNPGAYSTVAAARWGVGLLRQWTGLTVPELDGVLGYVSNATCPWQIPDLQTVHRIWLSGLLQDDVWTSWVNLLGQCTDPAQLAVWSQRTRPNLQQVQALYLRGVIQGDEYYQRCRNEGVVDQGDQTNLDDFLRSVPDGTRYVNYERAGIFDDQLFTTYYDSAYPSYSYETVTQTAGWSWGLSDVGPLQGSGSLPTIADAEWFASLTWPSPQQAISLLYRLSPDRIRDWEPTWMQNVDFTGDDVQACFDRAGVLPHFQDHLASLSVRLPGIRQINVIAQYGDLKEDTITDWISRTGLPQSISKQYSQALLEKIRQQRLQKEISRSKLNVQAAWELGVIGDNDVLDLLSQLGMQPDESQTVLELSQVEYRRKRIANAVKVLRRAFVRGIVSRDDAESYLAQSGIQDDKAHDLLDDWTFELTLNQQTISASRVQKDVVNGLISLGDAVNRFRNLRYSDSDIQVLINEMAFQIAVKQEKAIEKLVKEEEQGIKKLEQAIRQQQQAARQAQSMLSRHGTPRQLADWLCRGLIGEEEAIVRLTELGWPQLDQSRLITTACKDLSATQIADFAKKKLLTADDAIRRLAGLKYPEADAIILLKDKGVDLAGVPGA